MTALRGTAVTVGGLVLALNLVERSLSLNSVQKAIVRVAIRRSLRDLERENHLLPPRV